MNDKTRSIRIGGMAGDGVSSLGEMVAKSAARAGLYVATYNSYQSVIRGGHVWYQIRIGNRQLHSYGNDIDVLVGFTGDTFVYHTPYLKEGGYLIYDPTRVAVDKGCKGSRIEVPLGDLSRKISDKSIIQNTITMGILCYYIGVQKEIAEEVIKDNFSTKGEKVINDNISALTAGYTFASKTILKKQFDKGVKKLHLMTGNDAVALGAVASNCRFLSQYPMTPASSILHWLSEHSAEVGLLVKQTEDELAAINMAIGASFAGVRAMTATSGGGFSLMTEALGLAGMIEVPLVIAESQRSGPSTGLPTKTEQGDLNMLINASQGTFPRIVLAPADAMDAFYTTANAFNLADIYQMPVIIALDFSLSERLESIEELNLEVEIDRGERASNSVEKYDRYRYTETGISPIAYPGMKGTMFIAGSDEHDESSHLVSDILAGTPYGVETRKKMMEKRMKKPDHFKNSIKYTVDGDKKGDILIISWGSTKGVIREAIGMLGEQKGLFIDHLHLNVVWPLNKDALTSILKSYKRLVSIEMNYTGQLTQIIRAETGIEIKNRLLKYDGEPLYTMEVVNYIKEVVS